LPIETPLCKIAKKYHTDKAFFYTPWYHEQFKNRRENVKNVLEIGIGNYEAMKESIARAGWETYVPAASLYMWREYFPNASIVGLDNDIRTFVHTNNRIFCFTHLPESINVDFDLIVDDASHDRADQLERRGYYIPFLATGGIYVTEDITDPDSWPYPTIRFENEYGKAAISVYP
jgi:hypothetical protein